MDAVAAWKASSIVLTGAFGILGLATDFKDKHTHKVTKWGYISLAGIVISTVFGAAFQLKESADEAAQALILAQKADNTLTEIERLVTPFSSPRVSARFLLDCDSVKYAEMCGHTRRAMSLARGWGSPDNWRYWPGGGSNVTFWASALLFSDSRDLQRYLDGAGEFSWPSGDLTLRITATNFGQAQTLVLDFDAQHADRGYLTINSLPVKVDATRGSVVSMRDFNGRTLVLVGPRAELSDLTLQDFSIENPAGQRIRASGPFRRVAIPAIEMAPQDAFVYSFPKTP